LSSPLKMSAHAHSYQLELEVFCGSHQLGRCLLTPGEYLIGLDTGNEITINEESIADQHAVLTVVNEDEIYLRDLGSGAGTFVNGAPASTGLPIDTGSRIKIGNCTARLRFQRAFA
jgi:pSer/pThr/pTyr-binding forkhead associated (FHA) protein